MDNGNLKKFTKANAKEMGAKGGRAKKGSISIISEIKKRIANGDVNMELITKSMLLNMAKNPAMAKLITEYIDGKIPDKTELTGADGVPFNNTIKIEFVKPKK